MLEHFQDEVSRQHLRMKNAPMLLANLHLQQNDGAGCNGWRWIHCRGFVGRNTTPDYLLVLARGHTRPERKHWRAPPPSIERSTRNSPSPTRPLQARQQLQAMSMDSLSLRAQSPCRPALQRQALRRSQRPVPRHRPQLRSALTSAGSRRAGNLRRRLRSQAEAPQPAHEVDKLPDTGDDSAALKLYLALRAAPATDGDHRWSHDRIVTEMVSRYPKQPLA